MTFNDLVDSILEDSTIYFYDLPSKYIVESFEFKQKVDNTYSYFAKTKTNTTYDVNVTILPFNKFLSDVKVRKMYISYKGDPTSIKLYDDLLRFIQEQNGSAVFVEFSRQGEHSITNDMGVAAFEVFVSLKNAILDAVTKANDLKVCCIMFRTDKNEHDKRISLYRKIIQKAFPAKFKNILIDDKTEADKNYNIVYLY